MPIFEEGQIVTAATVDSELEAAGLAVDAADPRMDHVLTKGDREEIGAHAYLDRLLKGKP